MVYCIIVNREMRLFLVVQYGEVVIYKIIHNILDASQTSNKFFENFEINVVLFDID